MVQFNLPQNSKIEVGKHYKDITNSKNLKKINVYRWDPSTGQNPRVDTFEVDMDKCGLKVLDILFKIKNEIMFGFIALNLVYGSSSFWGKNKGIS